MEDLVGTLLLLGIGVVLGAIGMRILWLMSLEDKENQNE